MVTRWRRDAAAKTRSRLRLVVVQVMVLSLFATLFARLWYIQVVGGAGYQAAAQSNAVREIRRRRRRAA